MDEKLQSPTRFSEDFHDAGSISSNSEHNELLDKEIDTESQLIPLHTDEEGQQLPKPAKRPSTLLAWIAINVVSTICIIFVNKHIFSDPAFAHVQLTFAAYHFLLTFLSLHAMSLGKVGMFERRTLKVVEILPLAVSVCLSVVLQNTSLQYCSVPFYQTVRVLVTPTVAALNFVIYRSTIPWQAAMMLIPVCAGVGMMAYFDTKSSTTTTTVAGATYALIAVAAGSIYTIWVSRSHKKLGISSVQLLHQQSMYGAVMLMVCIPFLDTLPHYSEIAPSKWGLILLSGMCAIMINLSNFNIISSAGPVSSTVVGHGKTICIVALGWVFAGKVLNINSIVGILIAIVGIISYSVVSMYYKR